jgi:hypothetical protein
MNADKTEAPNVFAYRRSSAFIRGHLFLFVSVGENRNRRAARPRRSPLRIDMLVF